MGGRLPALAFLVLAQQALHALQAGCGGHGLARCAAVQDGDRFVSPVGVVPMDHLLDCLCHELGRQLRRSRGRGSLRAARLVAAGSGDMARGIGDLTCQVLHGRAGQAFEPGAAIVGQPLCAVEELHAVGTAARIDGRQAAELLGSHPAVAAWVKSDRLGLVIPYRKEGTPRKYLPDFIVELEAGGHLIIEINGQVGNALIKKAAAERWCRAVTNDGRFGVWKYHLCFGQADLEAVLT